MKLTGYWTHTEDLGCPNHNKAKEKIGPRWRGKECRTIIKHTYYTRLGHTDFQKAYSDFEKFKPYHIGDMYNIEFLI